MTRRLRYQVAVSLDGFIARTAGENDWIVMDPSIDFEALYEEFDTALMGRKTYDTLVAAGGSAAMPGLDVVVFSKTLAAVSGRGVRVVSDAPENVVATLKGQRGRDLWLYGGGHLFRTLLRAGLVDTVELAIMPALLGDGIPVLPAGADTTLVLSDHQVLPSGIVLLAYSVAGTAGPPPKIRYVKDAQRRWETPSPGRHA